MNIKILKEKIFKLKEETISKMSSLNRSQRIVSILSSVVIVLAFASIVYVATLPVDLPIKTPDDKSSISDSDYSSISEISSNTELDSSSQSSTDSSENESSESSSQNTPTLDSSESSEITATPTSAPTPTKPPKDPIADKNAIYVALYGNDQNDGSFNTPFLTPQRAIDEVEKLVKSKQIPLGGLTVYFMSGDYHIKESLILTAAHNGTPESPIKYSSYPGQLAKLTGGIKVSKNDFVSASTDSKLDSLVNQNIRNNIVKIDLKKLGITDFGQYKRRGYMLGLSIAPVELVINGKEMTVARWPNNDSDKLQFNSSGGQTNQSGVGGNGPTLTFKDSSVKTRINQWDGVDNVWIDGILASDWEWTFNKVESFDFASNSIKLQYGEVIEPNNWAETRGIFFTNVFEEMDTPGEYFIDTSTGLMYVYPNEEFKSGKEIYIKTLGDDIISLQDSKNLIFENLIISNSRGGGIIAYFHWVAGDRLNNIKFKNLTVENIAGRGIAVSGNKINIENCIVKNIGSTGINIAGGNADTLTASGNTVKNNHVYEIGYFNKAYSPAIQIIGIGNVVEYNTIHDTTHGSVFMNGGENEFRNNAIYNSSTMFRDMGSIYVNTGSSPYERDNRIINNYIKGYTFTAASGKRVVTYGVYIDNGTQGYIIEKNLMDNIEEAAIFIHGGGYNVSKYNIIKESHTPYFAQNLYRMNWGMGLTKSALGRWYAQKDSYGKSNSIYAKYPGLTSFYASITDDLYNLVMNASSESEFMNNPDYVNSKAFVQKGNTFTDTLLYNSSSYPINKNKYWDSAWTIARANEGAFISSYFGEWESSINISNIKKATQNPFNTSINGAYVSINLDESVINNAGIEGIKQISEKIGVDKGVKIGAAK